MDATQRVLIFDYDGVLADTERLHWKSWAAVMLRYGLELTWPDYCALWRGVDDARVSQWILERVPEASRECLVREVLDRKQTVVDWCLAESPIPRATVEMLSTLSGYRVGLVTSSERSEVEPILEAAAVGDKFQAMVFGGETLPKPAPDPYRLIACKLSADSGIAFEDSDAGIESAQGAGFRVVKIEKPVELAAVVARILQP